MDETPELETREEKKEEKKQEATPAEPAPPEVADPLTALTAERDRLAEEKASFYDQLLRAHADFQNYRKRVERDRKEVSDVASMEVISEILPVLDALERALASPGDANEFRSGIQLIARQLWDTLTRLGLEPVAARGQKFDPHLHQAVEKVETDEHQDQTILEEWQRGYLFRKRMLRPALVKVAVQRRVQ